MTEFLLLLSLWPHKAISPCARQGGLYFYAGSDKMIGFSSLSCSQAMHNWSNAHIDPVRMSRAQYTSPDGTCKAGYHIIFPSNVCGRNDLNVYSGSL